MTEESEEYRLSEEQLRFWDENGYLVIPDFVTDVDVEVLKRRAAELVDAFEPVGTPVLLDSPEYEAYLLDCGDKIHYFVEPEAVDKDGKLLRPKCLAMGKLGRGLHLVDPTFREFSYRRKHFDVVRALDNKAPSLLQSQYIFKQPGIGQAFRLHQDATYMFTEPISAKGLWMALEDAHTGNGCLAVLPRHHRDGLKERFVRQSDGTAGVQRILEVQWDLSELVPVQVKKGGVVIIDGLLPHCSAKNEGSRTRQSFVLHYVDACARYPDNNWNRKLALFP